MIKRMKFMIVIILVLTFILSGCSAIENNEIDKDMQRIAFAPPLDSPVWDQVKAGFMQASEDFGFYGEWLGDETYDIESIKQSLTIALIEDFDAVITCPLEPDNLEDEIYSLKANDIPLFTVAVDLEDASMRVSNVSVDYEQAGYIQATALCQEATKPLNVLVIMSTLDSKNQIIQVKQLETVLKQYPNSQIVAVIEDLVSPVVGMNAFIEQLNIHPEINAVFVTGGDITSYYGNILAQYNLQDSITLIGMDTIDANLDAIEDGEIYGVMFQDFYQMGYLSGKNAYLYTQGEEISEHVYIEAELITIENLEEFRENEK